LPETAKAQAKKWIGRKTARLHGKKATFANKAGIIAPYINA